MGTKQTKTPTAQKSKRGTRRAPIEATSTESIGDIPESKTIPSPSASEAQPLIVPSTTRTKPQDAQEATGTARGVNQQDPSSCGVYGVAAAGVMGVAAAAVLRQNVEHHVEVRRSPTASEARAAPQKAR